MPDLPSDVRPGVEAGHPRDDVVIRRLTSDADLRACVELQKRTWGENFTECVPPTILRVSQRIGGVTAGAFDASGRLLGFVFGLTGIADGEPVHWSDMLAVAPEARNLGLGRRLKEYQAEAVRALNVRRIYWTFDPLVARNAHLNLNKLGAQVTDYQPDMYGVTESALHSTGTDRLVVVWRPDEKPRDGVGSSDLATEAANTPILNSGRAGEAGRKPTAAVVRIEVPADIEAVQRDSIDEAKRWRTDTRAAFLAALENGYAVRDFYCDDTGGPCYYVLHLRAGAGVEAR